VREFTAKNTRGVGEGRAIRRPHYSPKLAAASAACVSSQVCRSPARTPPAGGGRSVPSFINALFRGVYISEKLSRQAGWLFGRVLRTVRDFGWHLSKTPKRCGRPTS
jgi:hypothetical protein